MNSARFLHYRLSSNGARPQPPSHRGVREECRSRSLNSGLSFGLAASAALGRAPSGKDPAIVRLDHWGARLRAGGYWEVADVMGATADLLRYVADRMNARGHRALNRACERSDRRNGVA